jgi:hypothetical protein
MRQKIANSIAGAIITVVIMPTGLSMTGLSATTIIVVCAIATAGVLVWGWYPSFAKLIDDEPGLGGRDLRLEGIEQAKPEPTVTAVHHVKLQAKTAPEASLSMVVHRAHREDAPEPDEWVQNATRLIVWGQWRAPIDGSVTDVEATNVLNETSRCIVRMRELAGAGKLHIWGRSHPNRLDELIPPSYWVDHQIDMLSLLDGRGEENAKTEPTTHSSPSVSYEHLQVNAGEFERLWFIPLPEAATRAYEETRNSKAALMAEQDGSHAILNWYGYALIGKTFDAIPIYGQRPPSRRLERVPPSVFPSSALADHATKLTERVYSQIRFTNLATLREGLEDRIQEIRSWG